MNDNELTPNQAVESRRGTVAADSGTSSGSGAARAQRRPRRTVIERADRAGELPLSFGQQQMWFLNRMAPDSSEYAVPMVMRLSGALDPGALAGALDGVVERHEILRTRYRLAGDEPVQLIDPAGPVDLPIVDLADVPAAEQDARVHELVDALVAEPFDLERGWPLHARLIRLSETEHVFAVIFHHIAWDAWSIRVFAGELSVLYRSRITGAPAALAPLKVQYADYAAWQRSARTLEHNLDYWRRELDGVSALQLPTDRPRPAIRGIEGGAAAFTVPGPLADKIRKLSLEFGTTPFTFLLTAYQLLLGRYCRTDDVAVGISSSVRDRPELQKIIGYGINTLVIRSRVAGGQSFRELVRASTRSVLGAFDHQSVPFARLVDELDPDRDLSRTPLYQVDFVMHEARDSAFDMHGLSVRSIFEDQSATTAKFDLSLNIRQDAGQSPLRAWITYASALFDQETVERMTGHYLCLLESIVANPHRPVSTLPMLPVAELSWLVEGVDPVCGVSVDRCVHELFELQAAVSPGAVAVVCGGVSLTYGELNARANRVAHYLRGLGAGPDCLVGVCLERGLDLIPTLLGVLKSGAAYVPLDPANPAERLGYILGDAGVELLVSTSALAGAVPVGFGGRRVLLDVEAGEIEACSSVDPVSGVVPANMVYVIYTSGSTGRPKGVSLTHENVVRLFASASGSFRFGADDVWVLFHSYAFDVSVWEMWGALLHGGSLVVAPGEVLRSPDELVDLLVERGVTVLCQTPSAFRSLAGLAAVEDARVDELVLRAVVFAGERLDTNILLPWIARRGLVSPVLVNMYGITETTVHSTYYEVGERDLAEPGRSFVGRPLADLGVHLLDADGRVVPVGVPGEIYVAGAGVARGYLGRAGLTAQRFVPDPFGPVGSRLYRSGDLARRLADGSLEFLGRIDSQVKIRGYRVELGEIQARLREHPQVSDAVVIAVDGASGASLAAYVVPGEGGMPDPAVLREFLSAELPGYMVPGGFVAIEKVPLTGNGKLDVRALPAADRGAFTGAERVAPSGVVQERIAQAWASTLGLEIERISVTDSFFDLGGDSIRAVVLAGAIRQAGYELSIRDVFEYRTIEAMAAHATEVTVPFTAVEPFALISSEDRALLPEDAQDAYPLSQIQTGMLVELINNPELGTYQSVNSFRVPEGRAFDEAAFRHAVHAVSARHDILRSSLHLTGYSQPLQIVHATAEVPIAVHRLEGLDEAAVAEVAAAFVADERARLFDLETGPLLRISIHIESDDAWRLTFTQSHAVTEGWSTNTLLMEVLEAYKTLREGQDLPAYEAPAVRYADFIAAELASLDDPGDQEYWRDVTDRCVPLVLPAAWADAEGPVERYRISESFEDLEPGLRALAAGAGASLKTVLLAAHLKVMSAIAGAESFHAGVVTHGRLEVSGGERVLGMHLNTLPMPFTAGATSTWRELVEQTYRAETEIWEHRRYPLPAIQRGAGVERLISVVFDFLDFHQVDGALVDGAGSAGGAVNEFALNTIVRDGRVNLTADTSVLSRRDAERLAGMYRRVLESMASDADGPATGGVVSAAEFAELTAAGVGATKSVDGFVIDWFEAQVAASPDAVAVVCGQDSVSYQELDERANRFAQFLRSRGVGAESLVALYLERSPEVVASVLGVWKAGAGYVPLDPSLPAERVAHILTDTRAGIVVTSAALRGALPAGEFEAIVLEEIELGGYAATPPVRELHSEGVAYVIYTSGSTGVPKGVVAQHGGVANYIAFTRSVYAGGGGSGAPLFSPLSFDLGVPNLFTPLVTGQAVRLLAGLDAGGFAEELVAGAPYSFVKLTPAHLELLTRQLAPAQARSLAGRVIAAGDLFSVDLAERWFALAGEDGPVLATEYGPTEITVGNSGQRVDPSAPGAMGGKSIALGDSIPNTTMLVLDVQGNLAPVGVPGEVYVSGAGVTRGYIGQPALTASRFVPNPYGRAGTRLYRTGDLGRRLADGSLEFLGRIDSQVKIRGYRVELGEIQARLRAHPQVSDAVVVVVDGTSLAAYVVPTDAGMPEIESLREFVAEALPEYMVPGGFAAIERIPLTRNGKLDVKALPAIDRGTGAERVAPSGVVQEQIAQAWASTLGLELDRISVTDSFFDLGGDSIRAVVLAGAIRQAGYDLGIRDIFAYRTIENLAAHATEVTTPFASIEPFALISDEDRALLPEDAQDAYPLSQIQTGMLVELLNNPEHNTYHNINSFRVPDGVPFSLEALEEAVRVVTPRHDILRTSVHLTGYSRPMQVVHTAADVPIEVHSLRGLDEQEIAAAGRAFADAERGRLFDPAVAPLLRINVHLESGNAWRLTFTQSHAITEGWSYNSLLMEILEAYQAIRDGHELPAYEAPAVRYADFIAAELASLDDPGDQEYWRDLTGRFAPLVMPEIWGDTDAPAQHLKLQVPIGDLDQGLRALAASAGASIKTVLLAAHLKVMSALTPDRAFHSGIVAHGRLEVPGGDRVLGMHLNTLPIPFTTGAAATWRELVEQTHAAETEIWEHRRYPLPAIQRAAGSGRLISVMFDYIDFHQVDAGQVDVAAMLTDGSTEFALHVAGTVSTVDIVVDTTVIAPAHADRLAAMFRHVLESMAAGPEGSATGSAIPAAELSWLVEGVDPVCGVSVDRCVHELFELQAAASPGAVAVVCGGVSLTYGELNARANRVAHYLRGLGAGPDCLVGCVWSVGWI